jgi:LPS-assembly lipoprotein
MPTASGLAGPAQRDLAAVYVDIIPERPGQMLRQALQERLGDDSGAQVAYTLRVAFTVTGEGIGVESNNLATRIRLNGVASWTLLKHDGPNVTLTSGTVRSLDGVNVFDSQYFAADVEVEAVQKRIAENLATQIATQLAVWFRQQAAKEAGQAT